MRFKTIQPDNPILRAEINYQQRTIPRWLQWFDRFGVIIVALAINLALLYFPTIDNRFGSRLWSGSEMTYILQLLLWISQLIVTFRCIFAGLNIMWHQKGWQEWDILVLTGITRKQLLIGKFWGALYQMRGWIVAFGIIKFTVFAFVIVNLIVFCYRSPLDALIGQSWNSSIIQLYITFGLQQLPPLNRIVVTGTHILAISMLEVIASVAIGILGGLIPERIVGLGVVVISRLMPMIGFTIFPDYPNAGGILFWRWYEYTWFTFADDGSTAILRSGAAYRGSITTSILLAFWAAIMMYIAYIVFAFLVSQYLLRRQGILSASSK